MVEIRRVVRQSYLYNDIFILTRWHLYIELTACKHPHSITHQTLLYYLLLHIFVIGRCTVIK